MAAQNQQPDVPRPLADFPPTIWGCSFALLSSTADSDFESYTKEVETLKETVKEMLTESTTESMKNIEFINLLCRLGVSYQFENEIDEQLNHIFTALPHLLRDNDHDLYQLALLFRVLRQHGYKMSCDVFKNFKNSNGEFKESLIIDVKGLLSLYEATFLSVHEEDILDEAVVFTRQHLEVLAGKCSPNLAKHIRNALYRPLHRGLERLEARLYISFYEGEESRNETLLKFAKLDFNRLQILYNKELAIVSRWWEEVNLAQELGYIRDRLVEIYIWAIGAHFEPQYSYARVMITMCAKMTSVMDDTYDSYATVDELQPFTTAFQRFDISGIDELPEYMKITYRTLLNIFDDAEKNCKDGMPYRITFLKEMFAELARSYFMEAKWLNRGYIPSFDEYMRNGILSSAYQVLPAASFLGMENVVGMKEYEWVHSKPKIDQATKFLCRLMDDVASHEYEQQRPHCPSCVECYMNDNNVSRNEAVDEINKMCENAWKDINEECMKPTAVSGALLKYYVNLSRVINYLYKYHDGYTFPSHTKDDIKSMFLEEFLM